MKRLGFGVVSFPMLTVMRISNLWIPMKLKTKQPYISIKNGSSLTALNIIAVGDCKTGSIRSDEAKGQLEYYLSRDSDPLHLVF